MQSPVWVPSGPEMTSAWLMTIPDYCLEKRCLSGLPSVGQKKLYKNCDLHWPALIQVSGSCTLRGLGWPWDADYGGFTTFGPIRCLDTPLVWKCYLEDACMLSVARKSGFHSATVSVKRKEQGGNFRKSQGKHLTTQEVYKPRELETREFGNQGIPPGGRMENTCPSCHVRLRVEVSNIM